MKKSVDEDSIESKYKLRKKKVDAYMLLNVPSSTTVGQHNLL